MRRRDFIRLASSAASWPLAARAQQPDKVYRIAIASASSSVSDMSETHPVWGPLFRELRRLGYVEGKNAVLLRFSAGADITRFDLMVRDVVSAAPDVIITSNNPLVLRFKALVHSIPVVAFMDDPLANGIVTSLARPDGNITGISTNAGEELWGKRLAMLLEAVPTATRVGFLCSEPVWNGPQGAAVREAARQSSVTLVAPPLKGVYEEPEYRRAFEVLEREHAEVLLVSDSMENLVRRHLIVTLAQKLRLPALYPFDNFIDIGGLMAYAGENLSRHVIEDVDMILKGRKPSEIPIYQASKFTTIVNLKTAKALGLTIPPNLLARADDVIE
jgi:putative tryptophan/tyrosine transport system substrate-binding protein